MHPAGQKSLADKGQWVSHDASPSHVTRELSYLEVLVSIIRVRHAFFPVAHSFTAKNNLFDAHVPASPVKAKLTSEVSYSNMVFLRITCRISLRIYCQSSISLAYLELDTWSSSIALLGRANRNIKWHV